MIIEKSYERRMKLMENTSVESKPMPILYSIPEMCKMFTISKQTALKLFRSKDFPAQKYGRAYKVEANALQEYLSHRHIL